MKSAPLPAPPREAPERGRPLGLPSTTATSRTGRMTPSMTQTTAFDAPRTTVPETADASGALGPTGRPLTSFPVPAPRPSHGPARVIALCNQKGGVGKTTTTVNLGAALAEYGRRVLLVDFDPQGALSASVGVNPMELDRTVYNVLMERHVSVDDVLLKTNVQGMDLVPSNIDLSAAEVQLVGEVAREQTLKRVLEPVLPDYD